MSCQAVSWEQGALHLHGGPFHSCGIVAIERFFILHFYDINPGSHVPLGPMQNALHLLLPGAFPNI